MFGKWDEKAWQPEGSSEYHPLTKALFPRSTHADGQMLFLSEWLTHSTLSLFKPCLGNAQCSARSTPHQCPADLAAAESYPTPSTDSYRWWKSLLGAIFGQAITGLSGTGMDRVGQGWVAEKGLSTTVTSQSSEDSSSAWLWWSQTGWVHSWLESRAGSLCTSLSVSAPASALSGVFLHGRLGQSLLFCS